MGKNLVIIPTYNEIENIDKMVHAVFALNREFELLIVDDGSPDGTATKVKELQQKFTNKLHIEDTVPVLGFADRATTFGPRAVRLVGHTRLA